MSVPYRTKDLNEAAFIWCQPGTDLTEVEPGPQPQGGKPDTFFFKFVLQMTDEEVKRLMFDYANEKCTVEPQAFVRKQNNLRDFLHQVKRRWSGKGVRDERAS